MNMKWRMRNAKCGSRPGGFFLFCILHFAFFIFFLSSCATAPKPVPQRPPALTPPPASPARPPPVAKPVTPPAPSSPKPAPPKPPNTPPPTATAPGPKLVQDELVIVIDSQPAGAIVVVNNIPIGKAPLRLKVKATPQGFFRDYVTIKARFLAKNASETSQTVEEDCTPLQKIPSGIFFTPQGSQRQEQ